METKDCCKNCVFCKHFIDSSDEFGIFKPRRCKNGKSDVLRNWFKVNENLKPEDRSNLECWETTETEKK